MLGVIHTKFQADLPYMEQITVQNQLHILIDKWIDTPSTSLSGRYNLERIASAQFKVHFLLIFSSAANYCHVGL